MKKKDKDAQKKLQELLHCGNERVELAAAKELLAQAEAEAQLDQDKDIRLEVEIRVVGQEETK